jgi:hypothetical protein
MLMLSVDGTFLDLFESVPVNVKYQYSDINEIQRAVGSYSQTFRIPATDNNRGVFQQFQNPNEVNGFNPKQKVEAILYYQTVPLFTGVVQLKRAIVPNGDQKKTEFEIVFFGDSVDLSKTLGNQKLSDLDLSAYNHDCTYANVNSSWSGTLFSGDVRYGLIDKFNWSNNGGGNPINDNNPLYAGSFTPMLRVPTLVQEILEQNGFELEGTFTSTDWDNYYTPLFKGKRFVSSSSDPENIRLGVGQDATQTINGQNALAFTALTNWSESLTAFYDTEGYFDPTTGYIQFDYSGFFSFQYFANVTGNITFNPNGNEIFGLGIRRVSDGVLIDQSGLGFIVNNGETVTASTTATNLLLEAGENYEMVIVHAMNSADSLDIEFFNSMFPSDGGTGIRLIEASEPLFDQAVDLANNAPDITQIDYLISLGKMFNLVFVPDRLNPKKINIQTYEDYHAGGSVIDWTDKLDLTKDLVIEPTTDIQKKDYEFTYSEGNDFVNQFYIENADRIYGRYLIEDTENDFATGTLTIQPEFGAFPLSPLEDLLIHKSIDDEGKIIEDPLCRVVYWGGLQNCTPLPFFNDGTSANVDITQYPYIGHYSHPNVDVEDIDLNYGGEIPPYPINSNPYDNLYNTYWRGYITELYSDEARILTAYFRLNAVDLAGFEFSSSIWIKDSYWRVLEIDATPNSEATVKVKLIKVLSSIRACEWLPNQANADGTVTFIDSNGVQGVPTAECCELFGYVYTNSNCYQGNFGGNVTPINPANIIFSDNQNGNVYAIGDNITSDSGSSGYIAGYSVSLSSTARNVLAVGDTITLNEGDSQAFGSNVNGFERGLHRGAGWWYDNYRSNPQGQAQWGFITFIYEGDFDNGDEVELFVEGFQNRRLSIPNGTLASATMFVTVANNNVATGVNQVQNEVYREVLKKNTTTSTLNGGTAFNPTDSVGTLHASVGTFTMKIDTTTDTTQHRIKMVNNSLANTDNTRIVCNLMYQMASF